MTHPATKRAVSTFLRAIAVPVDIGVVHPEDEHGRSRAWWQRRPLHPTDVLHLLPRLGRENAAGAAIYVRAYLPAGVSDGEPSPGLILVDDLSEAAVARLRGDGIEPAALVETSPRNFQAWIKLPVGDLTNAGARMVARSLAKEYGGDPRAVAFAQPGRLPGFTNRKERHRRPDGSAPFVLLRSTSYMAISGALNHHSDVATHLAGTKVTQAPRGDGAAETPSAEIRENEHARLDPAVDFQIERFRVEAEARVQSQVAAGYRPTATQSELDFALASASLRAGIDQTMITSYLFQRRPDKHPTYAARTVAAALRHVQSRSARHADISRSRP